MKNQNQKSQNRTLASKFVNNAFLDFMLSRQAMMCTQSTLSFYEYTLGKIFEWLVENGVTSLDQISSRHIRAFLGEMSARGCKDSYIHTYARAFKTYTRFLVQEGYISQSINIMNIKTVQPVLHQVGDKVCCTRIFRWDSPGSLVRWAVI